ncbi:hypothetical protein A3C28_00455 [Candidatus Roizmanbacteria bacterium RIFCSPHIGHO2_02_FULL_39_9]|uniref:DUF3298 domain-containing protein n=2 Tax=Candidatus Roizmaniibacteriota TaxID=1752723 RepID=A0A1F7I1T6_9BACT|nr:MAG: hypothetical protein A3C28_00455 [Candidatus Roizmanbacteria bacterium RIFCSPHIGHO2_02_FULL_39_9]OGK37339.1 MAG: hypothetical protein A3F60_04105 [Candidatus Roizmanbacteria bacterium RIFCSPHIGHO2_12_FULL_39_8]
MKKEYIFGAVLLLLLLIASYFAFFKQSTLSYPLQVKDATIKESNEKYSIDVIYPQVENLTNKTEQSKLNQSVQDRMNSLVAEFKQNQVSSVEIPEFENAKSELKITYTSGLANSKIFSTQFQILENFPGMAHPNNYNEVFNYNLQNASLISLSTLFKPDSNYLQTLAEQARKDLLEQEKENPDAADFINEGTGPTADNFDLFLLDKDGLVLIFNPAAVAPDYFGTMKVTIPYGQIRNLFNPEFSSIL